MADRYEPLPGVTKLPGWLWARMGRASRIAAGVALLAVVAIAGIYVPKIADIRDDIAATEKRDQAQALAATRARIVELQRPRLASGPREASGPRPTRIASRKRLVVAVRRAVARDSDTRPRATPTKRVDCVKAPGPDPTRDLLSRRGRYACTAVTSDVANVGASGRGVIGYAYRVELIFRVGRITMCQVAGQAAEGSLVRDARVQLSRSCGA